MRIGTKRSLQHHVSECFDIREVQIGFGRPSPEDIGPTRKGFVYVSELLGEDPIVDTEASGVVELGRKHAPIELHHITERPPLPIHIGCTRSIASNAESANAL